MGNSQNFHPTVKPVNLMKWLVQLVTPPAGIVLEPFAGSGSTLLACADLNVRCISIELNPEYADIARKRATAKIGHLNRKTSDISGFRKHISLNATSHIPCGLSAHGGIHGKQKSSAGTSALRTFQILNFVNKISDFRLIAPGRGFFAPIRQILVIFTAHSLALAFHNDIIAPVDTAISGVC